MGTITDNCKAGVTRWFYLEEIDRSRIRVSELPHRNVEIPVVYDLSSSSPTCHPSALDDVLRDCLRLPE